MFVMVRQQITSFKIAYSISGMITSLCHINSGAFPEWIFLSPGKDNVIWEEIMISAVPTFAWSCLDN